MACSQSGHNLSETEVLESVVLQLIQEHADHLTHRREAFGKHVRTMQAKFDHELELLQQKNGESIRDLEEVVARYEAQLNGLRGKHYPSEEHVALDYLVPFHAPSPVGEKDSPEHDKEMSLEDARVALEKKAQRHIYFVRRQLQVRGTKLDSSLQQHPPNGDARSSQTSGTHLPFWPEPDPLPDDRLTSEVMRFISWRRETDKRVLSGRQASMAQALNVVNDRLAQDLESCKAMVEEEAGKEFEKQIAERTQRKMQEHDSLVACSRAQGPAVAAPLEHPWSPGIEATRRLNRARLILEEGLWPTGALVQ